MSQETKTAIAIDSALKDQNVELSPPQLLYVALKALEAAATAPDQQLRAVYEAALTLCHNALDESRPDQMVLVPGDDLQVLNDALTVVEEAEADHE